MRLEQRQVEDEGKLFNYTELRLSTALLVLLREKATYEQSSIELVHCILKYSKVHYLQYTKVYYCTAQLSL